MTDDEIHDFLRLRQTMNIASFGPDGNIHLVAMWYGFLEGAVAFETKMKAQKVVNLRRDPKLTALVEDGETYNTLRGVELVGTGTIVDDFDTIMELGVNVGVRYNGPAAGSDEARPFLEAQARKRLAVVIEVDKIVTWDHTKLGGTY